MYIHSTYTIYILTYFSYKSTHLEQILILTSEVTAGVNPILLSDHESKVIVYSIRIFSTTVTRFLGVMFQPTSLSLFINN